MIIDPFRFSRAGEYLEKVLKLKPVKRLDGIITENSDVTLSLTGSRNENNRFMLDGHIKGSVIVQCQVCLNDLPMPLDIRFRLFPVMSEQQAERLHEDLEPLVIEDNSLDLIELVINELILTMPVVNSHIEIDGTDCADINSFSVGDISKHIEDEKNSSPFAVLKSIKQKDS